MVGYRQTVGTVLFTKTKKKKKKQELSCVENINVFVYFTFTRLFEIYHLSQYAKNVNVYLVVPGQNPCFLLIENDCRKVHQVSIKNSACISILHKR